jgi:RNA polymerase sigma-70 factor, ECF subfamily
MFGGRSLGYLRGLVGDEAEDAQQDLWLKVFRSIGTLQHPEAFRTWLFTMTRYAAMDRLRMAKREQELLDTVASEYQGAAQCPNDDSVPDATQIAALVRSLPLAQREVCILRYNDALSYADIALVVGCSVGTVRSRLHYARQRLRQLANSISSDLAHESTTTTPK